jgi:hypothetical protein
MKRIAFLYLEKTYGVYHNIGIAIELSLMEDTEVVAFCNKRSIGLVKDILAKTKNRVKVAHAKPYWHFELPVYAEIKIQMRNIYFYKYRKELSGFDAIVSTLYNDLSLKKILPGNPKLIFSNHGISNRSYSFSDEIKGYDFILLPSLWEKKIREQKNQLKKDNYAVIGYPKLDVIDKAKVKLFDNNNKTILYNPHWERAHSSYFDYGKEILSFFKKNTNYNLIFSPHSLLKERYPKIYFDILKFRNAPNIRIDLGSEYANNMTYTVNSDIYLGDFSSQALEFALIQRRPCIFINDKKDDDEKEIAWGMGKVFDSVNGDSLSGILNDAEIMFEKKYRKEQDKIINRLFTLPENSTSSKFAAHAIYNSLTI